MEYINATGGDTMAYIVRLEVRGVKFYVLVCANNADEAKDIALTQQWKQGAQFTAEPEVVEP